MREIETKEITMTVSRLLQEACYQLPDDVIAAWRRAREVEESPDGCQVFDKLLENAELSVKEGIPLVQDTGIGLVFLELGQDAHIVGGDLYNAVNEGVRQGYDEGYLRKSIVYQPFSDRINTGDNTPATIYTDIVSGDRLRIIALPQCNGGEMKSRLTMLFPASGRQGIIDFVVETVDEAGSYACIPWVVGVGIGGSTVEKVAMMAKRSLLRKVGEPNPDAETAELERELLQKINNLGIGPMGYGGRITALAVHAEVSPTHMAGLPVVVNLQCVCIRRKEAIL